LLISKYKNFPETTIIRYQFFCIVTVFFSFG